jgi:hypothetical protein
MFLILARFVAGNKLGDFYFLVFFGGFETSPTIVTLCLWKVEIRFTKSPGASPFARARTV